VAFSPEKGAFLGTLLFSALAYKGKRDIYLELYCSRPWRIKAREMSYLEPYCSRPWHIKERERFIVLDLGV